MQCRIIRIESLCQLDGLHGLCFLSKFALKKSEVQPRSRLAGIGCYRSFQWLHRLGCITLCRIESRPD